LHLNIFAITMKPFSLPVLDSINIGLMFLSLILALYLPFELFLFSYAVLGPLHYLTEISWLHKKDYFLRGGKTGKAVFAGLVFVLGALLMVANFGENIWQILFNEKTKPAISFWTSNIVFMALATAFIFVLIQKRNLRIAAFVAMIIFSGVYHLEKTETALLTHSGELLGSTVVERKDEFLAITNAEIEFSDGSRHKDLALLLKKTAPGNYVAADNAVQYMSAFRKQSKTAIINAEGALISLKPETHFAFSDKFKPTTLFFAFFIPTIIHVFFFTALFMWFGALKTGSKTGLLSVAVLFFCGAFPFIFDIGDSLYIVSDKLRNIYNETFYILNLEVLKLFKGNPAPGTEAQLVYSSVEGLALSKFIAFAYTYHYLNWFSKTSVIQWHKVPVMNLIVVSLLWISSVALYLWNYKIGLQTLLFLSFLHVFMEFPLNIESVKGILNHYFSPRRAVVRSEI
jgi:hypothetical protein